MAERRQCGDAAVGDDLPGVSGTFVRAAEFREETATKKESKQGNQSRPSQAPGNRDAHQRGGHDAASREPLHSSNSSSRIRRRNAVPAPWAEQRACRNFKNSASKS